MHQYCLHLLDVFFKSMPVNTSVNSFLLSVQDHVFLTHLKFLCISQQGVRTSHICRETDIKWKEVKVKKISYCILLSRKPKLWDDRIPLWTEAGQVCHIWPHKTLCNWKQKVSFAHSGLSALPQETDSWLDYE